LTPFSGASLSLPLPGSSQSIAAPAAAVYRRDLETGDTLLVSRGNPTEAAPAGEAADGEAYEAVFVGESDCEGRLPRRGLDQPHRGHAAGVRGLPDFCAAPTTELVSLDEAGEPFEQAPAPSTTTAGRVAFIAQGASFELRLLYVRDLAPGQTTLPARASGPEGEPADYEVTDRKSAVIAARGCRAIFATNAMNLIGEEEAALPGSETFVRQLAPCKPAPPEEEGTGAGPGPAPAPGAGGGQGSQDAPTAGTSGPSRPPRCG
jgi:hypothetical protein